MNNLKQVKSLEALLIESLLTVEEFRRIRFDFGPVWVDSGI